ncbi:PREDICTED: protein PHLOEM PROTEIN 2-LIKE A5-like [Camelina sativa]|uniref:Protein PHLOEM PROTEIN 2-LIKE A5-like n=1 Tax=Camelina sativa TaxID=90675 RepID=A0ABM0T0K0_CAMSA|nr:PREDICTED: protein PHLOEM PROTEIN 2-LIKE A5-like [Camelina sativa]
MTFFSRIQDHQVFINYRGEQLGYSFVSHLVDAFERHDINFFVDKYELRGQDLKNLFLRIEESRIALVIFSTRYPESSWCMDELVKIKQLSDKEKLQVIPIFYKVKAREVKNQTGLFGENFWTLARGSTGDQIKKWKEGLESISDKMGLSMKDKSSEAVFVKEIVTAVKRVITAIGLEEGNDNHVNHVTAKKRKTGNSNCLCELPDFKRSKIRKHRRILFTFFYTLLINFLTI